ncbi:D-aminopeptidase [Pullulanibacillus pueri]|uniref:Aminopeptidase n=1 Tax=Pullulanibacillus pueri TaxID=1437324 RepID=A0A8J3EMM3_9BACL|nr:P1 family peptidase [Pullulanibacillus pueri]MBM7680668.1 D-aminopeptidase [Pullulanibacillus pueri]GGH83794.1 aminopeptidase [Pullulanibacillus pueri]
MQEKAFIRDYGIIIGSMDIGKQNAITDVAGVMVGHQTLKKGPKQTGVTVIKPHPGNIFKEKVIAASHVFNGFGKTVGTIQIDELGTIETPIVLTNTLSVPTASEALIDRALKENPDIGRTTGTINPVVGECNDMLLNDIRAGYVKKEDVLSALNKADQQFEQGSIGAGTGMVCMGLKGGIGSASRCFSIAHHTYTLGVLVLTNFGRTNDFILNGKPVGNRLSQRIAEKEGMSELGNHKDQGSIMMVVATDLPLSCRQLKRVIKRAGIGLGRTGSYMGNGSGDIVIGFSTAHLIPHDFRGKPLTLAMMADQDIEEAFQAVVEATEEAILNALITAETTTGRDGKTIYSLHEFLPDLL